MRYPGKPGSTEADTIQFAELHEPLMRLEQEPFLREPP